ncbi:hypothetical protein [Pedobacter nyackensis]|uniref:Uncharacterized protein n=1 Tax=Pedobacter nyackensis TaxID=475255 RepID=A0A1W2DVJ9_9SPHI|nr:hypothetical protein [Pedobacter nyackensis]SMD01491.1 hypothetical protein SAMN04488101_108179 [Pedobacter nyackensis]
MNIFRQTKDKLSNGQEQTAEKIADKIVKAQRKVADYLSSKTAGISVKTWRLLLIGFCILFGGYCIYLLAQVFNN